MDTNITMAQLGELLAQAKAGRITRSNLQEFLRDPTQEGTAEERGEAILQQLIREGSCVGMPFRIQMGWDALGGWSFHDQIQKVVGEEFDLNFLRIHAIPTTFSLPVDLCDMNVEANSEDVFRHVSSFHLKPAGICELLGFGEMYREVLRYFTVAALGTEVLTDEGPMHPYLVSMGDGNGWKFWRKGLRLRLGLFPVGYKWPRKTRFLIMK